MRYVVQVQRRGFDPSTAPAPILYGPFKSEEFAHALKASARQAGANAEVLPVYPGNRYTAAHPYTPSEDPRAR